MADIHGWHPFNITTSNAVAYEDFGPNHNTFGVKNTDASIVIWIRLSLIAAEAAAASAVASFPLAAGESVHWEGLDFRWLSYIAASGTPVLKGYVYNRQASQAIR